MTQTLWLSFDLGIKGDYEGLFRWLDGFGARECVGTLAYLNFPYHEDLLRELASAIKEAVSVDSRTRVYVLWLTPEGKRRGRFLFGRRIAANWAGYAPPKPGEVELEEA